MAAIAACEGSASGQTNTASPPGGSAVAQTNLSLQPSGAAVAQTDATLQPGGAAVAPPPPSPSNVDLQIGPRFWYMFHANAPSLTKFPNLLGQNSGYHIPMAGGVGSARFGGLPDTSFSLSVLYGSTTTKSASLFTTPLSTITSIQTFGVQAFESDASQSRTELSRYDIELLAQTTINPTWAWIVGLRYERDIGNSSGIIFAPTTPITRVTALPTSSAWSATTTAKFGMAGAAPITASGDLRFFGNLLGLAGSQSSSSASSAVVGGDMSVGLQYQITPSMTIDARYRALVIYNPSSPRGSNNYSVEQGPMISLNYHF